MRRLYIAPLELVRKHNNIMGGRVTTHWLSLYLPANNDHDRWESDGSHVVLSHEFQSEASEEFWSTHQDVTTLPHPVWYGRAPITAALEMPENAGNRQWGSNPSEKVMAVRRNRLSLPSLAPAGWGSSLDGEDEAKKGVSGIDHLVAADLGVTHQHTILDVHRVLAQWHPALRLRVIK